MIGRLRSVVFDAPDVTRLAAFYEELTGWPSSGDETWMVLSVPGGRRVCLQAAPDHVPPQWPDPERPQQIHLDLLTPDIESAAVRAVTLGATRLAEVDRGEHAWVTLADPAGHPFDLCRGTAAGDGVSAPMGLIGPCLDTDDPARLGRFYADVLGMSVEWEGDEGLFAKGDAGGAYFQRATRYVRPQWPDPAHPQQGHLDILVGDVDAAEHQVLALGATRLPGAGDDYRVFADPSGHPFCLVFGVDTASP